MTWERFGYICRRASVDCHEAESISECLSRIENEKACELYGNKIPPNSIPRKILSEISRMDSGGESQKALDIYKELNLSKHFEEPMKFKRVLTYLGYVTFIFYIVVGIYQFKVAPSFLEAFENFDIQVPSHLTFYQNYWEYFVLAVSIILISALVIGFRLKKLFNFGLEQENSWIVRFLVFPTIRRSYLKVVDILLFPILADNTSVDREASLTMNHLKNIKESKLVISREMQELIEIEMRVLLESCEKQMKYISVSIALIVVVAVFLFLASAYSPIFILGETV